MIEKASSSASASSSTRVDRNGDYSGTFIYKEDTKQAPTY